MIEIVNEFDKSQVTSRVSRDVLSHCSQQWQQGNYFVLAGNISYQVLLAENECQRLKSGDTEFRRSQALEPCDILIINLQNLEAVKLTDYDL